MSARGYLLEGDLYMARFIGGVPGPLLGPFEGTVFSMKPNGTTIDMISKGRNSSGEILESVSEQQPTDFNVTFAEADPELLAIALLGTATALSQTAGNFSAAPLSGAATVTVTEGAWVELPRNALGSGTMTFTGPGATALTEGVDYELNRHLGLLRPVTSGSLQTGEVVTLVAGAFGTVEGKLIRGGVAPDVRAKFILDGRNRVDGADMKVSVWEAILRADAVIDFLSGGYLAAGLTGRMKRPAGKLSAFEIEARTAAA